MTTKDKKINADEQLFAKEVCEKERKISDDKYALKIVEKIVFGLVGLILVAVVTALLALVIKGSIK